MTFDPGVFPVVWLWCVYGGWRGIYTAAFEAWTSYPGRLDKVIEARTAASPRSRARRSRRRSRFIAFEGLRSVSHVSPDGRVSGEE